MASDSDSVSSSSSSEDDEYLLSSSVGEDREAMIRRKLLESFYGASEAASSSVADEQSDTNNGQAHDDPQFSNSMHKDGKKTNASYIQTSEDLDAPNFSASAYVKKRIYKNSAHELLTTANELSQSIRLLDSTMQTLVYENYSKFISATDAIRSIGQSAHISNDKLQTLQTKMNKVELNTQILEENLSEKRKEVVEKLKLKRLLNRLKSLVELPSTLKNLQEHKKFKSMTKDYIDAMVILNQHSGFESLENIQVECKEIMMRMIQDVGSMVYVWCVGLGGGFMGLNAGIGRTRRTHRFTSKIGVTTILENIWKNKGVWIKGGKDLDSPMATDISDVFECVSALLLYSKYYRERVNMSSQEEKQVDFEQNTAVSVIEQMTEDEYMVMTLESCTRLLKMLLDDHDIESNEINSSDIVSLYPAKYLQWLLEAASLFSVTFQSNESHLDLLTDYVSLIWFPDFTAHVKSMIVRHSNIVNHRNPSDAEEAQLHVERDGDDEYASFMAISQEMIKLVGSMREIASALALPEIGLNVDIASALVEETVAITESLVRRRVTKMFHSLRCRVLKECLSPFVLSVLKDVKSADQDAIVKTVEKANTMLSESMQLIDDGIRSMISHETDQHGKKSGPAFDSEMINEAIVTSARSFAFWLASTLEILAGCEPTISSITMDLKLSGADGVDDDEKQRRSRINRCIECMKEYENEASMSETDFKLLSYTCDEISECSSWEASDVLLLSLIELCRLCERNLITSMNQSISSFILDSPSPKNEFFQLSKHGVENIDSDGMLSCRFLMALSRSVAVYASTKGHDAICNACQDVLTSCSIESEFFPHGPSDAVTKILEIAKIVCLECNAAFGTKLKASDLPDFGSDYRQDNMSITSGSRFSTGHGAMKGLSLDIARIFNQRVQIYESPYDVFEFSSNSILSSALRVAIKAWSEHLRLCSFSTFAYRQIQVDAEFLKYMLPHYISQDNAYDLTALINDLVTNAGERCLDSDCVGVNEFFDEAMGKILSPLSIALGWLKEEDAAGGRGALEHFVIREDFVDTDDE